MNQTQNPELIGPWSDKLAQDYVDQWGELLLHERIPQFCQLQPTEKVLDIGCGSGAAVRAIASQLTSGHVTGIDPTPKMIEIATHLTANDKASFLQSGAEQLPFDNQSLDLVIAVNTLHHWDDVDAGLNEVLRVLKPSGRLVCIDDLWEELPEFNQDNDSCQHELKTRAGIVELLADKGFRSISDSDHREPDATASIIVGVK